MSGAAGPALALSQRQAEILGLQFNSAITNAGVYGVDHPVAERALRTLMEHLAPVVRERDPVTLMLDRGAFFIEDFQVDARFNANRLAVLFRSLGLESISFGSGVDVEDLKRLAVVVSDKELCDGVDGVRDALAEAGVESIRVNHVVLRKFTTDDEVIDREGLAELTGLAERAVTAGAGQTGAEPEDSLAARIEQVFSMAELVRAPEQLADEAIAAADADDEAGRGIAARIRDLGEQLDDERTEPGRAVSPAEVMTALSALRERLSQGLAGQQELARLMGEQGGVLDEVDRLTCRTIVSILREELRTGQPSPQRLAQLVRRVLPDSGDLKRLMPMLKRGLLDEGMRLDDYVAFVKEVASELQDEGIVQALESGAESIGLGVEEILREIRRDPGEAARLVVLASELRQAGRADEDKLSEALTEYIERISAELAADDRPGPAGAGDGLREAVFDKQKSLLADLRSRGVSGSVADRVEAALGRRLDDSTDTLRGSRVVHLLDHGADLDDPEIAERLAAIIERESRLRTFGGTLQRELESHGYSAERIETIYSETLSRLKRRNRVEFVPGSVMSPVATNYFLQREIATATRYGTHFSCIMLMIARLREGDEDWRTITTDEIERLMPQVFDILPPHLRDLDLLGTLGTQDRNIPLAILPMTDEDGAQSVMKRMLAALEDAHLELSTHAVRANVLGTAMRFDPDATSDSKSFVQAMKGRLATQVVTAMRSG